MEPRTEGDGGTHLGHVPSPEQVAREFLHEGGGVAPQQQTEEIRRRRTWVPPGTATATAAGAVAVLVLLAVLVLVPSRPLSAARAASGLLAHPTHNLVKTSASATTVPLPPPTSVTVDVLNADGSGPARRHNCLSPHAHWIRHQWHRQGTEPDRWQRAIGYLLRPERTTSSRDLGNLADRPPSRRSPAPASPPTTWGSGSPIRGSQ